MTTHNKPPLAPVLVTSDLFAIAQGIQPRQTGQPTVGQQYILDTLRHTTRHCVELLGGRHDHPFGTGIVALNTMEKEHLKLDAPGQGCGCPARILASAVKKVQEEDGLCVETTAAYAMMLSTQTRFHSIVAQHVANGEVALPVLKAAGFYLDYLADLTFTAAAGIAHIRQLLPERTFNLPVNSLTVGRYISEVLTEDELAFVVGVASDALYQTTLLLTAGDDDAARAIVTTIRRTAGASRITAVVSARVQEDSHRLWLADHRDLVPAG